MRGRLLAVLAATALAAAPGAGAKTVLDVQIAPVQPVLEADWGALLMRRVHEAERLGLIGREQERSRQALSQAASFQQGPSLPRAKRETSRTVQLVAPDVRREWSAPVAAAVSALTRTYALIDTRDAAQVRWAAGLMKAEPAARLIVTAGPLDPGQVATGKPQTAKKREKGSSPLAGVRLYGDQGGFWVRRFAVTALPVRIHLSGTTATVRTVVLPPSQEHITPIKKRNKDETPS